MGRNILASRKEALLSKSPRRILLPRFDGLGDIVLLEGFLESLQGLFSQAKLALLVRPGNDDLSSLFPATLEWISTEIDPLSATPDVLSCEKLLSNLGVGEWDLVLVTSYNRTWADDLVAAGLTSAKRFAIGEPSEVPSLYRGLFTRLGLSVDCPYDRVIPVDETSQETEKYEILWRAMGGQSKLPEPRLSVPQRHKQAVKKILDEAGLKSQSFCLCFPAGTQKVSVKAWPPDRFAEIITWMEKEYQLPSLVAGHQAEANCIETVVKLARKQKSDPKIWLGKDGQIPTFAALAAAAKLYVGNDTGPMHIAAAVKTPVVAMFGGGHGPRFRPRGKRSLTVSGEMPCFGCGWDCLFADGPCMSLIAVQDVKVAVERVYDKSQSKQAEDRVMAASTKLNPETKRYIEKAVETHREIEADRVARLEDNRRLKQQLKESEKDRAARLETSQQLENQLKESEKDRAARLKASQQLELQLKKSEKDRAARLKASQQLENELKESEKDRAARLKASQQLELQLKKSEKDRKGPGRSPQGQPAAGKSAQRERKGPGRSPQGQPATGAPAEGE